MKVSIRMATNDDGPAVGALVEASLPSVDLGKIDWSEVSPYWLVAEVDDQIVGCLQIALGKPFGHLEHLALVPDLPDRTKAKAVKAMVMRGLGMLTRHGAAFASFMVPFEMKSYARVLKRRGGVPIYRGNAFIKRLT